MTALPPRLEEIVEDFEAVPAQDRLQLLLELSDELPTLPERYEGHREAMEHVPECQSPLFLAVEVDDARLVHVFMDAPAEAPTTR
ncbi:MAG: SufE family protein, partial [Actinomycetes bacterium]